MYSRVRGEGHQNLDQASELAPRIDVDLSELKDTKTSIKPRIPGVGRSSRYCDIVMGHPTGSAMPETSDYFGHWASGSGLCVANPPGWFHLQVASHVGAGMP
jgi:hypothetical protein